MKMPTMQTKSLNLLLADILADSVVLKDVDVTGISLDSRQVQTGWLFLSLALDKEQRLQYLQQALSAGATSILFDGEHVLSAEELSVLTEFAVHAYPVNALLDKAGEIAARFYEHPSAKLTIIAITGTNGKTSVSQFIAQALESLGHACGVIGTLGVGRADSLQTTGMTTPDPVTLQALLADFCQQNIDYVVLEASSHALAQGRLNSVAIDVAVLTNLSRDHLDYHKNMDDYTAAKARLFSFPTIKTAVINSADSFGQQLLVELAGRDDVALITYSSQPNVTATICAADIQTNKDGLNFNIISEQGSDAIQTPLLGRFNVDNLLATLAGLLAINIPFEQAISSITQCHAVAGRMQVYGGDTLPQVVVDFAHTPDALTQVLQSLRAHTPNNGLLWCVFGCGGDRDQGKRALMGRSAELNADRVVLTDDNPRSEGNAVIIHDILSGVSEPNKVHIEANRQLAITHAVSSATLRDVVLVAGKGHEQYQEIAGTKHPFNDAKAVINALQAANDELHLSAGGKQ